MRALTPRWFRHPCPPLIIVAIISAHCLVCPGLGRRPIEGVAAEEAGGRGGTRRPRLVGLQHTAPFHAPGVFLAQMDKAPSMIEDEGAPGFVFGAIRASFDTPLGLVISQAAAVSWVNVTCGHLTFRSPRRFSGSPEDDALAFELHLLGKRKAVRPPAPHHDHHHPFFREEPASNDVLFVLRGHLRPSVPLSRCTLRIADGAVIGNHHGQSIERGEWPLATASTEQTYRSSQRTVFVVELPSSGKANCIRTKQSNRNNVNHSKTPLASNDTTEPNASGMPRELLHRQSARIMQGLSGRGVVTNDGRYISALELQNLVSTGTSQPPSFVDAMVSAALSSNLPEVSKQLATALTDRSKAMVSQKVVSQTKGDVPRVVARFLDVALTYNLTGLVTDAVSGALPPLLAQALHESLTFGLVKPAAMFISEKIKQVVPPVLVAGIARSLSRGLPHLTARALVPKLTSMLTKSITHSLAPVLGSSLTKRSSSSDVFCGQCVRTGVHCNLCHDSPQSSYYRIYYAGYYSDFFSDYYAEYYSSAIKMLDVAVMEERREIAGKLQRSGKLEEDQTTRTVGGVFEAAAIK